MRKIPSLFVRLERSSLVDTGRITPECAWVFDGDPLKIHFITIKRDGTPVRWKDGAWSQRRTLKSRLDPGADGIPTPANFVPCQPLPGYDDESQQWEWPGWVPIEHQYAKLLNEAVVSRGGMKDNEDGLTFELCGPKINGNPEGWDTHHIFSHGDQVVQLAEKGALTVTLLCALIKSLPYEGVVIYEGYGNMRMAKLKRRDLGLEWPIKVKVASTLAKN